MSPKTEGALLFSAADIESLIGAVRLPAQDVKRDELREALNVAVADYCANVSVYGSRKASLDQLKRTEESSRGVLDGIRPSARLEAVVAELTRIHRRARSMRIRRELLKAPKRPKRRPDRALNLLFRELESVFFDFFERKPGFSVADNSIGGPFVRFMLAATRFMGLDLTAGQIRDRYRRIAKQDRGMGVLGRYSIKESI